MQEKINIVTVNHNSSMYVEMMLRSLFQYNNMGTFDYNITVLDNRSNDTHLPDLKEYLRINGIPFEQTGFDNSLSPEKHGETLKHFILANNTASYFLFLDADMWFEEKDTIQTMIKEITQSPEIFAVQARIHGFFAKRIIEGKDGFINRGDFEHAKFEMSIKIPDQAMRSFPTTLHYRCSPVCSLIKNLPIFRKIVEDPGLTAALVFKPSNAIYYDTFALMTTIMELQGLHHIISAKTVMHFTETSHRPEWRSIRDEECLKRLNELRQLK